LDGSASLDFAPRAVGSWWDDRDEIDVVAPGDEDILLAECKWTTRPVGANIIDDLRRKGDRLNRTGAWSRVHYALFARAGFTPALTRRAEAEGIRLIDLAAVCS